MGWTSASIGSLCELLNGRAFKPSEWSAEGLPIVRIQNLNNPQASFNRFSGTYSCRHHLRGGELLFAWSGTPGTSFGAHVWRQQEALLNQHIFRVDFDGKMLDKRFFRHAINQKLDELIGSAQGGVGLRHVTKGVFEATEIAIAPRPEQTRIADKLDALLARVDACRDRLHRAPAILKRFRTAVLAAATSGQLTEDWRALRGATKQAWEVVSIGDLIEGIDAGLNVQCDERPPTVGERGLIKISAVTWGRYDETKSKTLPPSLPVDEQARIAVGDLLISRANTLELVGACVIVDEVTLPLYLSDKVLRLRTPEALKPWLLCALRSPQGRQQIEQMASGNQLSMRNLSQSSLKSIRVPMPPEAERSEATRRVEALLALSDSIEARLAAATSQVERLTPALLTKAFRGELVPQDPNDEPASALLERLRAGTMPAKRSRRRA